VQLLSSSDFSSASEAGQPEPTTADPAPAPEEVNEAEDAEEGEGPKLLSKKEKERLKKEKEKVDYISLCRLNSPNDTSSVRQKKRHRRLRRRANPPKLRKQ
jgi:hypothetical protein